MIVGILLFLTTSFSDAGGTFLIVNPSARSASMGFTGVTIYEDPSSGYFNPANLAFLESPRATYLNKRSASPIEWVFPLFLIIPREPNWLDDLYPGMNLTYWAYTLPSPNLKFLPLVERINIGYDSHYLCTGKTEGRDEEGNKIGEWITWDIAKSFTFSVKVKGGLGFGLTYKDIYSFLAPSDIVWEILHEEGGYAETETCSWGALFAPGVGIRYGFSYLDTKGKICYISGGEAAPLPHRFVNGYSIHSAEFLGTLRKILKIKSEVKHESLLTFVYAKDWTKDRVGSNHKEWISWGTEIGVFNCLYMRRGHFEDRWGCRIGSTEGYGIRIGPIAYDVGDDSQIYDFQQDNNWRVSMTIGESHYPFFLSNWRRKHPFLVYTLGILVPGAGHIELGEKYKGFIYFGLTNLLIGGGLENKGIVKTLMLTTGVLIDLYSIWDLKETLKK